MNDLELLQGCEVGSLVGDVLAQVAKRMVGNHKTSQTMLSELHNTQEGVSVL